MFIIFEHTCNIIILTELGPVNVLSLAIRINVITEDVFILTYYFIFPLTTIYNQV